MSEELIPLTEAVSTLELWAGMMESEQEEIAEPTECDEEERRVIRSIRRILKENRALTKQRNEALAIAKIHRPSILVTQLESWAREIEEKE